MRIVSAVIFAGLPLAPAAPGQHLPAATRAQIESGMDTQRTRALNSLSESTQPQSPDQKQGNSVPWRSLSSEAADDPTISTVTATHIAQPAARKSAQKAAHLAGKGRHQEAIAEFRKALRIDPQYYEAANNLALELAETGHSEEAEQQFRHLIESNPEHVLAFTNLATLLLKQQRYRDAEAIARQALKFHEFSFRSNYLLAAALVDQGHWTEEARLKLEYAQVKYSQAKLLLDKWPAKAAN